MDYSEFRRRVSQPLTEIPASFDELRVEAFYKDLLHTYGMAETIEASLVGRNMFDLASSGEKDEVHQLWHQQLQIITLLKALYMFADILIIVLLHEALGRPAPRTPGKGISLNYVISQNLLPFSRASILPAYCVVNYRNVLIAHHDYQRMEGYTLSSEGSFRLSPASPNLGLPPEEQPLLERLWEKYNSTIPHLAGVQNYLQRSWILFYNIPIEDKRERQEVNRLVERVGCESMTRQGLLNAIDQFALEVVEAVRKI